MIYEVVGDIIVEGPALEGLDIYICFDESLTAFGRHPPHELSPLAVDGNVFRFVVQLAAKLDGKPFTLDPLLFTARIR